ncbi:flagellar hook-length control protein FliK [Enterovibrio nigricans]|uniref:Hook-length control protein FliK n=1 Tax=Enterovibrio nigricans DSM 22720 TaxID=1121868 RepID=A0A1T4U7I1_9GAMM|nr:flagellar hook-length control protein FliK [Enterovibrio nigricans]PKF51749.1 hypothetical protein AT251_01735 [Enterovibrio nigricans]SKA48623.1 hook-length control protein FliK [Enterovibrio nigricans DSM 22720]
MKIDNTGNINVLTLSLIQNSALKEMVKLGPADASNSSLAGKQFSQLSQLLQIINVFPSLFRIAHQQGQTSPLLALLNKLVVPSDPQLTAKWLAERQPDKALLDGLKTINQLSNTDENASLKAAIQLLAEQRFQESPSKPGDYNWIFCFGQSEQFKVDVSVKNKTPKKRKKSRWSISVNLTMSNNRQLVATAELEDQALDLSFTTDSESLKEQLEKTLPVLERQLVKHSINITSCDIATTASSPELTINKGLDIQV